MSLIILHSVKYLPPPGRFAISLLGNPATPCIRTDALGRFSQSFLHGETRVSRKRHLFEVSFATSSSIPGSVIFIAFICPRQESNLDLEIRNLLFYPLNYGSPTSLRLILELRRTSSRKSTLRCFFQHTLFRQYFKALEAR